MFTSTPTRAGGATLLAETGILSVGCGGTPEHTITADEAGTCIWRYGTPQPTDDS